MGIQVVTIDKQHICPMIDGNKPHKGGAVIEGISGVFIDGKPIALVGSQTEHGGNVVEGVPGVTVSGGFVTRSDEPEDFEPQIFNLQWKREDKLTNFGEPKEQIALSADVGGYDEGETVKIKIYDVDSVQEIDEVEGIVQDSKIKVQWVVNYKKREEQ